MLKIGIASLPCKTLWLRFFITKKKKKFMGHGWCLVGVTVKIYWPNIFDEIEMKK